MLAALQKPMRIEISDTAYNVMGDVKAASRVRDTAELEVLKLMRQPNVSKIMVTQMNEKESLLEIEENLEEDGTVQKDHIFPASQHEKYQATQNSRRFLKKVGGKRLGLQPSR